MLDSDLCFAGFVLCLVIAALLFPGGRKLRDVFGRELDRSAITKLRSSMCAPGSRVYLCKRGPVWRRWPTRYLVVATL